MDENGRSRDWVTTGLTVMSAILVVLTILALFPMQIRLRATPVPVTEKLLRELGFATDDKKIPETPFVTRLRIQTLYETNAVGQLVEPFPAGDFLPRTNAWPGSAEK